MAKDLETRVVLIDTECGLGVRQKAHLEKHTLIHTGEKYFTCTVCNKSFSLKESLQTHMSIHGESRLTCRVCGKGFGKMTDLKRHMMTHTGGKTWGYVCNPGFVSS